MTPEAVLQQVGATAALEDVRRGWDASMAALPADGPEFLRDACWQEYSRCCGFGADLDAALGRVASTVRGHPALLRLAWHCYWRVFLSPEPCPPNAWPEPVALLGAEEAGLFYVLVGLAFVPLMQQRHREWGFPETVTRQTAQQVSRYCQDTYRRGNDGRPGLYIGQLGWLRHYTRERYVRLGRLEYWLGPNPYRLEVYRHRRSRQVVALAPDGTHFAADGTIYRDAADYREGEGWTAAIRRDESTVSGLLVDPNGRGTRQCVTLPLADWACTLQHGDHCLMLHIPSGGAMDADACRQSLAEAASFFKRHFPRELPLAVVCTSWIFSPQLLEIFPPEANLCRFQRNLFLFPVPSAPWDGLWFVFLKQGPLNLDTAPAETSLQRGILDYLKRGHRWRLAGMFFLLDDVPAFGSEPYRSQWPPPIF